MAGEGEATMTNPEETPSFTAADLQTVHDEGSMNSLLEKAQGQRIIGEDGEAPARVEDELEGSEALEGSEGSEISEAKVTREAAEDAEKEKAFNPKHKSWEETEAARKEAERTMHESNTRAKQEAEAREALERERDELKQKLEAVVKPLEKPVEEVKSVTPASRKAKVAQALKTIRDLDPQADDYDDKLAEAWADAGVGAEGPSKEEIAKEAAKIARAELQSEAAAEKAAVAEETRKTTAQRAWEKAIELGTKAGLDLEDPESADSILFERMEKKIPDELVGKPLTEAVEWMVAEVQKRTGKVALTAAEKEAAARKHQAEVKVLGRGQERPAASKKAEEPYTMGSLMEDNRRGRRL